MRQYLAIISLFICVASSAGNWKVDWNASLRGAGSSAEYMPFWARTGEDGILPMTSSGLVVAGADLAYAGKNSWQFETGVNVAGALAQVSPVNDKNVYGVVNRLYVSGGWKMLHVDLGIRARERELSQLSVTGGNLLWSGNAVPFPGINLRTDWIYFDRKKIFAARANLAHYWMTGPRYIRNSYLHNKSLSLKVALSPTVDFILGGEHLGMWGGDQRDAAPKPVSFRNFVRIFFGKSGGSDASVSDQINALGNHLGNEYIRLSWKSPAGRFVLQYDKPWEDNSGICYQNAPDGVWTVQWNSKNADAAVSEVVFEWISTTWQSGLVHDRPATEQEIAEDHPRVSGEKFIVGGCDNYFNHSEYRSGWTNYGRVVGLPLFAPMEYRDGYVTGITNTRLRGVHLGMAGKCCPEVTYRAKSTYTSNWGTYSRKNDLRPWQLSLALEFELSPELLQCPLSLSVGAYGDIGELYRDSVGLTLRVNYTGRHRWN